MNSCLNRIVWLSFFLSLALYGCRESDVSVELDDDDFVPIHRSFERELISRGVDDLEDGFVLYKNIKNIETLHLSGGPSKNIITSLSGIEYFKNLRNLSLVALTIDSLNLSQNAELIYLSCSTKHFSNGQKFLRHLNVSGCQKLRYLFCGDNRLTFLDIGNNKDLTALDCSNNNLEELVTSPNSELRSLSCSNNPLRKLSLTRNVKLENLKCKKTQLSTLDVSMLPNLHFVDCYESTISSLVVGNNLSMDSMNIQRTNLKSLDFTQVPNLVSLTIGSEFGEWTDPSMLRFAALEKLKILRCTNLKINKLDVSVNAALELLQIDYSQLAIIDLSQNERLKHLDLWVVGSVSYLDVRRCKNLDFFKTGGCLDLKLVCVNTLPDLANDKWDADNFSIFKVCK